jgi:hypothetical protein
LIDPKDAVQLHIIEAILAEVILESRLGSIDTFWFDSCYLPLSLFPPVQFAPTIGSRISEDAPARSLQRTRDDLR